VKSSQVTIKDIAAIAGVSFSTVSRCLNDSPLVSDVTKRKVTQIAAEMGFEFNASARGLITSKIGTVGIVLPENYTAINVNVYHGMLMNHLRTSLERADVDLLVTYQKNHFTGGNNINRLVTRRKIDGLILLTENIRRETLDFLEDRQIPFVCTHYPPANNVKDQDVIYTDHYVGGKLVAEHLLARGRRSFLLLAVEEYHLEFQLREQGFCDAIASAGHTVTRLACDSTFDSSYATILENREMVEGIDAVFALNDLMGFGTLKALKALGRSVPEDTAVVGYDDTEYGRYYTPTLSSVHQPREELAVISCDRLFFQMQKQREGGPVLKKLISIQPVLMVRESS
jgi:LacI family transcriptional regulator